MFWRIKGDVLKQVAHNSRIYMPGRRLRICGICKNVYSLALQSYTIKYSYNLKNAMILTSSLF